MHNYLTEDKLINLLSVYYFNKDWHDNIIDYTKEKYFRLFNSLPDKNISVVKGVIKNKINLNLSLFLDQLSIYKHRWKYSELTDDDILVLFTTYYLSNGNLSPNFLIKRYSNMFSSFKYINDISQVYGLHKLAKQQIGEYKEFFNIDFCRINRFSKILKINGIIKT